MASTFQFPQVKPLLFAQSSSISYRNSRDFFHFGSFLPDASSNRKSRSKFVAKLGDKWKLADFDANAVQDKVNSWLSRTQILLTDVTAPLAKKAGQSGKFNPENAIDAQNMDIMMTEQIINNSIPNRNLSLAAIISIEEFSRMNGQTGERMQNTFKTLVPETLYKDDRNFVEYCCFRFLSRDSSEIHPSLKEPTFQRLIFVTMLAWETPNRKKAGGSHKAYEESSLQGKLVGKEAFARIAPAVSGVADRSTVDNLFKALAGAEQGISIGVWLTYVGELLKVHERRIAYQIQEDPQFSHERVLCIASTSKRPVLKWENNMAWPGKLILTDKALYFQPVGLAARRKESMRFNLTKHELRVEKSKVGPFSWSLFDSAVSISSGPGSETWVLEFVDLGGEFRRDVWHAFISEVIALHKFVREYGPEDNDESLTHVFGAPRGKEKATISAINSIARLQALRFMQRMPDDPIKLVQFSYIQNVPYGDIVCQTFAVNYWGGPLMTKVSQAGFHAAHVSRHSEESFESSSHVSDMDGSVYFRRWMKSPTWKSKASIDFWKNSSVRQGVVLSKHLMVADLTLVERAVEACRQKCQVVESTQATIDAAMLKGIPSNIDLLKELLLPLVIAANNFDKLRCWEEPHLTVSFLAFAYTIIVRDLLSYVFPVTLMVLGAGMLSLKGLRAQGRLGRSFGKVTIRDQPPSNTIQKIIAVKDAMRDVENYLQNLNVMLLKLRTIVLSGHPQITTEISLVLLSSAAILLIFPFKWVAVFFLFDLFTRKLEFRREMVKKFMAILKERWDTVPASPVVVLPIQSNGSSSRSEKQMDKKQMDKPSSSKKSL